MEAAVSDVCIVPKFSVDIQRDVELNLMVVANSAGIRWLLNDKHCQPATCQEQGLCPACLSKIAFRAPYANQDVTQVPEATTQKSKHANASEYCKIQACPALSNERYTLSCAA